MVNHSAVIVRQNVIAEIWCSYSLYLIETRKENLKEIQQNNFLKILYCHELTNKNTTQLD